MKVLVVEDDDNKRAQLLRFIGESFPDSDVAITRSLQAGLRQIRNSRPELVLLDMTLPTYDVGPDEAGGSTNAFGGRDFLGEMKRFKIRVPVIVVTQFVTFGTGAQTTTLQALDEELRRNHESIYLGAVYYHAAIESWKDELRALMQRVQTC